MNTEGPFRSVPKGDEEFDPEKHVKVDEKSWVKKSAIETAKKAEAEAERRNAVIEEPNWFSRLFGKTNKETGLTILQEEALETHIKDLTYSQVNHGDSVEKIQGIYGGNNIELAHVTWSYVTDTPINDYSAVINGETITKKDAKKIWKKLDPLIKQRDKNREKLKRISEKTEE